MKGYCLCFSKAIHLIIVLSSLFYLTLAGGQPVGCHDNERSALLQLKQSLIIDPSASSDSSAYPKVLSWKQQGQENSNCCLWDGIKCDEETGHVIRLDLGSSCLYGSINSTSSLFYLVHLERLSLADNDFNGSSIPSGIISLPRLSHLNLSYTGFSGQIPSQILELSQLLSLDVSSNDLELHKPSLKDLEKLTNLNVLDLRGVKIFSSIPPSFTNFSSLTSLSLMDCGLQGELPAEIFQLPKLQVLNLSANKNLIGHLPELQTSSPLRDLRLSSTGLSGELSASIGNLTQLTQLAISRSSFSDLNSYSLSWIGNLNKLTCLDLMSSNLSGEIPSVLMNLTELTKLCMGHNKLSGPIPLGLMNLKKLSSLYLHFNELSGHIPVEIRNLTQLMFLRLTSNQLEGPIPNSIFELKNLQRLDLFSNNLSGEVDLDMFLLNFKSLDVLVLSSNKLSLRTRPDTVSTTQQKFWVVGLGSCNLTEFPYFLHNQDRLISLDLSSNKIASQVPGWFINVTTSSLQYLNLSYNQLIGFEKNHQVLPWTILTTLDLSFNKLEGPLPVPLGDTITYLVSNNQLIGEVPSRICNLNYLYALDLSYNKLSGIIPECGGNFGRELSVLKLQGNNFHGCIPATFINGTSLAMIDLSNNSFQGRLPKSVGNCVGLKFLNLGNNQITDNFPLWLGTLPELEVLILKSNNFFGTIKEPETGFEFPKLRIIDLSWNRFTGNLPSKYFLSWNAMKDINASKLTYMEDTLLPYGYPVFTYYGSSFYSLTLSNKGTEMEYQKLSNLITAIILSNNKFVGEIPPSIVSLKGLRNLNLSNNDLEGHIPPSLDNLTVLESFDLSNNELSGEIPQQLAEITTLAFFNVSNNNLVGPIPHGKQFDTFEASSFDGNPGLCGELLSRKCVNHTTTKEEDPHGENESVLAFSWSIFLIGFASGTTIGVVLGRKYYSKIEPECLAKSSVLLLKTIERMRRCRNN